MGACEGAGAGGHPAGEGQAGAAEEAAGEAGGESAGQTPLEGEAEATRAIVLRSLDRRGSELFALWCMISARNENFLFGACRI